MRQSIMLVVLCMMVLITKYVISGGYYDYMLQQRELQNMQARLIDDNKQAIAGLENYRSANYLFSQKEALNLQELTSARTILIQSKPELEEKPEFQTEEMPVYQPDSQAVHQIAQASASEAETRSQYQSLSIDEPPATIEEGWSSGVLTTIAAEITSAITTIETVSIETTASETVSSEIFATE